MAEYFSVKMKRKDLEQVYDGFSDFSLSSPARKIRRLDVELPPIMEEEELAIPQFLKQPKIEENLTSDMDQSVCPEAEAVMQLPLNDERALVLYKPVKNKSLLQSSSSTNFSITINSDLVPGLKDHIFWSGQSNPVRTVKDKGVSADEKMNDRLAVVPWHPSQLPPASVFEASATGMFDPMEAEDVEAETMEIGDDNDNNVCGEEGQFREMDGMLGGESLRQWQQQHCMTPQLPQNTATHIMWSW